jgi:hypothetical protein
MASAHPKMMSSLLLDTIWPPMWARLVSVFDFSNKFPEGKVNDFGEFDKIAFGLKKSWEFLW